MIFQLDWFVDFEPPWLPPSLLIIGSIVLVYGLLDIDQRYQGSSAVRRAMIAVGIGLVYLPFHSRFQFASVVILSIAGKFLEGVASVRAYQKIKYIVAKKSFPGRVSLTTKGFYALCGLFLSIVSGWLFIGIIISEKSSTLSAAGVIAWTITTGLLALLGMSSTLWGIRQKTSIGIIFGFSLMITGAEIHNLAMLSQEITLFFVNTAFYGFGFVVAAVLVIRRSREVAMLSNRLSR